MAHLLRGKQSGVQNDLSTGITPDVLVIDDIARFGINSQISQIAYDPVQSLLAVGTNSTKFGRGQIYIFGQKRVQVVFSLSRSGASVKTLQLCADKLICYDSKNDLSVYSLETKKLLKCYTPPGTVTAVCSDPTLDYVLLGMQNGDILAYDIDREALAPLRIPNFWIEVNPRARILPIITLAFHPRDIGTLLIGYGEGAAIYSFKQNKALKFFHYQLPRGAPGGEPSAGAMQLERRPRLTQALWHPTGTFILTGHEDGSLVFWDAKDGRVLQARTLQDTNINRPGAPATSFSDDDTGTAKEPLYRIAWCANKDPDDTCIVIAGGASRELPTKGLTLFELGRTPNYATSSWQLLSEHLENPRRQRILPTPPSTEVVDFCVIPRSSPHFAGSHDPIAVLALLASGEVLTLSFPSGLPITPTNQLHPSLTFVHPFVSSVNLAAVERTQWLGMSEHRSHGPPILKGGVGGPLPLKRFEHRNVVQTAHADGIVRLWDAGHGDELENDSMLEVDVGRAVGRHDRFEVTKMSLAGATGELVAGLQTGEVIIWRWGHNKNAQEAQPGPNKPRALTDISNRKDPQLSDGLMPFTLYDGQSGPVTAVKLSDVGFVAAGFEGGDIIVIDLRGPAIILNTNTQDFLKHDKRMSVRRHNGGQDSRKKEWATIIEFSVMTLDDDDFSSILLHVGTNLGHLATFKVLPEPSGRYNVQFVGAISVDDRVIRVHPMNADSGTPAYASQPAVSGLRTGSRINGVLVTITTIGARIFRPATSKGAHKAWDDVFCDSAAVCRYEDRGYALVGLFGDGNARAYSLPGLKEIGRAKVSEILDVKRFPAAQITATGDILGWLGPSEMGLVNIFGAGLDLTNSKDVLFNPDALIPPRPTISNFQWVSGTQYITPSDLDLLIGGPDRPPSKRMIAQARSDEAQRRADARSGTSSSASNQQDEGYWAYMQRQIQERTEKLGIMNDNMANLQQNSSGWADDVSKFVNKQKRGLVMGAVKSKFGF